MNKYVRSRKLIQKNETKLNKNTYNYEKKLYIYTYIYITIYEKSYIYTLKDVASVGKVFFLNKLSNYSIILFTEDYWMLAVSLCYRQMYNFDFLNAWLFKSQISNFIP